MHSYLRNDALDVGGTTDFWTVENLVCNKIDLLNMRHAETSSQVSSDSKQIRLVIGDARHLPYDNDSYDIVFSNSVIEHVGSFEDQMNFAKECSRVGRKIWIQTPARSFLIEPHFMTFFIHWLPKKIQKRLVRRCSLWGLLNKPTPESICNMVDEIRLISLKEMRVLFPDCQIYKERVGILFVKSYIAYRG